MKRARGRERRQRMSTFVSFVHFFFFSSFESFISSSSFDFFFHIHFHIHFLMEVNRTGELFLQVVCGEKLLVSDTNRYPDPFVAVKVINNEGKVLKKWKSRPLSKTLNPVWNEGSSFLIPSEIEEEVKVCIVLNGMNVFDFDVVRSFYVLFSFSFS